MLPPLTLVDDGRIHMNLRQMGFISLLASAMSEAWAMLLNSLRMMLSSYHPDTYRPEAHYMRGPGPKWREKQMRGRRSAT